MTCFYGWLTMAPGWGAPPQYVRNIENYVLPQQFIDLRPEGYTTLFEAKLIDDHRWTVMLDLCWMMYHRRRLYDPLQTKWDETLEDIIEQDRTKYYASHSDEDDK